MCTDQSARYLQVNTLLLVLHAENSDNKNRLQPASFPGPAQLSVAVLQKAGRGLGTRLGCCTICTCLNEATCRHHTIYVINLTLFPGSVSCRSQVFHCQCADSLTSCRTVLQDSSCSAISNCTLPNKRPNWCTHQEFTGTTQSLLNSYQSMSPLYLQGVMFSSCTNCDTCMQRKPDVKGAARGLDPWCH